MAFSVAHDVPLFAGCSPDDAADGLASFRSREFAPGELLMAEEEDGRDFFLLLSGTVAVSSGGRFERLLSGPTFVGEEAMLGLGARSATVRAMTNVEALVTGQIGFDKIMRLPGVGRSIAAAVATRLREREVTSLSA